MEGGGVKARRSYPDRTVAVLLALTVTTGVVDAASYIGLGHVFTANMTGNVVLLGFGLAGAGGLPVIAPLVSLAAFVAGAQAGGVLGRSRQADGRSQLRVALVCEGVLVLAAAVLAAVVTVHPSSTLGYAMIAGLALAMGIRNATVRRLGVPDLTTTVLTMTLTGLASESLRGGDREAQMRRIAAVVAMLGGAVVGGLLVRSQLAAPLWLAAAVAIGCRVVLAPRLAIARRS